MLEGFCCENACAVRDGSFISGMMISRDLLWDHPGPFGPILSRFFRTQSASRVAADCGAVQYTVQGDAEVLMGCFCHCESCRRAHAAPLYQVCYVPPAGPSFTAFHRLSPPFYRPFTVRSQFCRQPSPSPPGASMPRRTSSGTSAGSAAARSTTCCRRTSPPLLPLLLPASATAAHARHCRSLLD